VFLNRAHYYNFINAVGDTLASGGPNLPASPSGTTMFTYIVECPCQTDAAFTSNDYGMTADFDVINDYTPTLYNITWTFGDGSPNVTGTLTTSHTYSVIGTYLVSVNITKISDPTCIDIYSDTILVNNCMANGSFTYTTSSGYTIAFNSTYDYDTTNYYLNWDFGDGTIVTGQNDPEHNYGSSGYYTVSFSVEQVSDSTCFNVFAQTIYVAYCGANAQFTFTTDGYQATFNAPYSYSVTYHWNFGDGTTYNGMYAYYQNHTYATADTFHVTLTVTNNNNPTCSDFYEIDVYVDGCIADASFSSSSLDYTVNVSTITYFDPSLYSITWYFGDGTTAQGLNNTSHIYSDIGEYDVSLVIHDLTLTYCTDSITQTVTVWGPCPLVSVDFTWIDDMNLGFTFLTDTIYESSDYNISWDFGDGTTIASAGATEDHTYYYEGTFNVILTITHAYIPNCFITASYTVEAHYCEADAQFNYNINSTNNHIVYFHPTNLPTNPNDFSFLWEFGDSTSVTGQTNPSHTYLNLGIYYVTLTIVDLTNPECYDVEVIAVNICDLAASFIISTNLLEVTCTAPFDPGYYHIAWDFGDGSTAEGLNSITHTFSGPGTYHICMTLTELSTNCVDDVCHNVIVTADIFENNLSNQIIIYPNPVIDNLYIKYDLDNHSDILISILNSTGQLIFSNRINHTTGSSTFNIDTHNFAQGIYYIKLEIDNESVVAKEFFK
jgi:PKD repeat protein